MVLQELLIKMGLSGGGATVKALDKVDSKVKSVTDSFRSLGGMMTGIFAGLSIKSIIDTADHMQSLEFRLGQMQTSVNGGADAFDNLAKHAKDSRVSIESYAEAYTGIGAATHELIKTQEDLANVTDSVAMGLQLAGANTQQTTSVMQQLTQAIAVGKLQWADMRIIMQNSDAFAGRLAESLGMTLNEMVRATQGAGGGIGADKIVNALRSMSGQVRKEFSMMPMTVSQALTVIGVRWDAFIQRLNRSTSSVSQIADAFLWMADKVEHALDWFVDSIGGAENAVKLLTVVVGAAGLLGAISLLPGAFAALLSPVTLIIAGLVLLYAVGEDVYRWLNNQSSALGDAIGPAKEYSEQIHALTQFLHDLRDMAKSTYTWISKLADILNASQDWGKNLGDKLGTTKFAPWLKKQFFSSNENTAYNEDGSINGRKTFSNMLDYFHQRVVKSNPSELMPVSSARSTIIPYRDQTSSKNMTVNIGSIEVPAGTSEQQASFIQTSAKEAFQKAGLGFLSDDLMFNRGVSR